MECELELIVCFNFFLTGQGADGSLGQRLHFVLTGNTAEVPPKTLANVRRDHLPPSPRAEDEMDHAIRIGVRHRLTIFAASVPTSTVPTGLLSRVHGDPPPSVKTLGYFQTPLRGTADPTCSLRSFAGCYSCRAPLSFSDLRARSILLNSPASSHVPWQLLHISTVTFV